MEVGLKKHNLVYFSSKSYSKANQLDTLSLMKFFQPVYCFYLLHI